jgi:hypothetical protein
LPNGTVSPVAPVAPDPRQEALDAAFGAGFNPNANGMNPLSQVSPTAAGDVALQYKDDPYGYAAEESRRLNYATGGENSLADISKYQLGGDPNFAKNAAAMEFGGAAAAQGRTGVQLDQSGVAPWQTGLQSSASGLGGVAGQQLAMAQMPAGPSVAELAMKQQADAAQRQQMSMAAGARGGNSALALQNAAANSAGISGTLNQNLGVQRAAEDMSNRQFSLGATNAAANTYGQQGSAYGTGGQLGYNVANADAGYQDVQRARNDAYTNAHTGQAYSLLGQQSSALQSYDQQRTGNNLALNGQHIASADTTGRGTVTGSRGGDALLGGALTTAGAVGGTFVGGPAGGAAGAAGGGAVVPAIKSSDIRAKKNIAPADEQVSDAFRFGHGSPRDQLAAYEQGALRAPSPAAPAAAPQYAPTIGVHGRARMQTSIAGPDPYGYQWHAPHAPQAPQLTAPPALDAPASRYEYRDPSSPGADPGEHYGPMAQDLEKTPAGASVVSEGPDGKKRIDTGRLALVNASETSKQRKELDALSAAIGKIGSQISGTQVSYPGGYGY